jgi:hypothetical protein
MNLKALGQSTQKNMRVRFLLACLSPVVGAHVLRYTLNQKNKIKLSSDEKKCVKEEVVVVGLQSVHIGLCSALYSFK